MIHFQDLNQLALAGQNNDAILMDDATGEEIRRFRGHTGPILDILYAPIQILYLPLVLMPVRSVGM